MADVTITHADGSTDTIPGTTAPSNNEPNYTRQRELLSMRRVRIHVFREDAQNANLEPKSDRVDFEGDTLRLVDIDKGGSVWRLTCYSYEWDANRTPPTVGGSVYEGTDKEILTDLINAVPNWSVGSIAELTGPLSFVFSHAHIHDAIRRVEKNVPGELLFRDGGTVDYVNRIGSDKSGSIELSGTAGTIEGEIEINDKGREMDGTHIRVLGVHEGEAQLFVNLVPQDDPQSYENEVRYNAGTRWQDSSDTDWDSFENKDVTSQATLEREAETLADELADGNIEAKATTPELNVDLGDTVQVVKPDAEIDRPMRIHRIKELVSGATKQLKLLLSTRTRMRTGDGDDRRSIRQFNKGFQGSSVAVNIGPVIDSAEQGDPLSYRARIPDLEFINTAEIFIRGESYRIDSKGSAAGGGFFETSSSGGTNDDTTASGGSQTIFETSDPNSEHGRLISADAALSTIDDTNGDWEFFSNADFDGDWEFLVFHLLATSPDGVIEVRVSDDGTAPYYPRENGLVVNGTSGTGESSSGATIIVPERDPSLELEYRTNTAVSGNLNAIGMSIGDHFHDVTVDIPSHIHQFDWLHDHTLDVDDHTHPPDPGIFTTNDTPDNVDVDVNGTTVASNVGSGTFETVVDITGELNSDSWNDFSFSTDSLGRLQTVIYVEGYNQIGQQ